MAHDQPHAHGHAAGHTPGHTDAWHAHDPAAQAAVDVQHATQGRGEQVDIPMVLLTGTVCFIIVVACVVLTWVYFLKVRTEMMIAKEEKPDIYYSDVAQPINSVYKAERERIEGELRTAGWVDAGKNLARPTASDARKRVMDQYLKLPAPAPKVVPAALIEPPRDALTPDGAPKR